MAGAPLRALVDEGHLGPAAQQRGEVGDVSEVVDVGIAEVGGDRGRTVLPLDRRETLADQRIGRVPADRPPLVALAEHRYGQHGPVHALLAALFVGPIDGASEPDGEPHVLIEANIGEGVTSAPLSKYFPYHTRLCRPVGLSFEDRNTVCRYAINRIGFGAMQLAAQSKALELGGLPHDAAVVDRLHAVLHHRRVAPHRAQGAHRRTGRSAST